MATQKSTDKVRTAPAPDSPYKPASPTDLKKPSWMYIFRKARREFSSDQCTDLAAALTYYMVLSLFPGLLALVSLLGLFGQSEEGTAAMLALVNQLAPGDAAKALEQPIQQFSAPGTASLALVVGIVGALWSASGYVGAFGRAMNRIYEVDEGRPFWKLRPMMILLTVILVVLAALMLVLLVVSGPIAAAIGGLIGMGQAAVTAWNIVKWPVLILAAVVSIALLYYATPNVKQPKFRWISMGAFIALLVLAVATAGFGFYVANFGHYNRTYGAIGGVIVMLLWLWLANLSLLFGAEFDAETERGRELQAGIRAEETLQLPPRDTHRSEKQQQQARDDVARGRLLRVQSGNTRWTEDDVEGRQPANPH
ncbi:YihY/virulence factor BrkB family protein [Arthrobacter sp. I2-34]|uniref:YihY/virulence factor BrkB family protein n=1 Tax=Arthrobacter hankyongi TaxID=2904801 RepID=A0ABS9L9P9_9MICC|nr:YihY/virulence factor BrkB family protein [Arthrobacter hankyongi]MCG2623360.1 YihY/virulence factor BrkB family protein [Arthrobacter hankyongi]